MCIPIKSGSTYNSLKDINYKVPIPQKQTENKTTSNSVIQIDHNDQFKNITKSSNTQRSSGKEFMIPFLDDFKDKTSEAIKTLIPKTVEDIKSGAVLGKDSQGPAIEILKKRLEGLTGIKLPPGDKFDIVTEKFVKIIQKNFAIYNDKNPNYGKIDKKTWEVINNAILKFPGNAIPLTKQAEKFADQAKSVANSMGTTGNCYAGVWKAIVNRGLNAKMDPPADHAYQFGEWAMTNAGKKAVSRVMPFIGTNGNLIGLKPGDIIVYNKGVNHHSTKSGHIEVYKSNNEFYSDHNSSSYPHGGYNDLIRGIKNGDLLSGDIKILRLNPTSEQADNKAENTKSLKVKNK